MVAAPTAPPPRAITPETKVEARCPKLPRVTPAPFSWSKQPCEGKGEQTPAPDGGVAGNPQMSTGRLARSEPRRVGRSYF